MIFAVVGGQRWDGFEFGLFRSTGGFPIRPRGAPTSAPVPSVSAEVAGVEFKYEAPEAQEVFLVGSFNDWNVGNLPMPRDTHGVGRMRVPLAAGSHEYRFVADGVWNDDPRVCGYVSNQFGWCNCVVTV